MEVNHTPRPAARAAACAALLLAAACAPSAERARGAAPAGAQSIRQAWRCIPDAEPAVVPAA
ncbi:MAG TPA: hypothetical protein VFQ45_01095, partial [Longimicrobium sp.]|nr:hypothetical protein [Longimicrobium sp.]